MATVHGFPVRLAGRRLVIVEMPDCWAIMNSFDAFPQATFRFTKDEPGWREAVAQLNRSDIPDSASRRSGKAARIVYRPDDRKLATWPRLGVILSAAVLGASSLLPWALEAGAAHSAVFSIGTAGHLDLFGVLDVGWRRSMAWLLVAVAVLAALEAFFSRFARVRVYAFILGFVALAPTTVGIIRVNDFTNIRYFSQGTSLGLTMSFGAYVALGGCVLLMLSWAIFPQPQHSGHRIVDVGQRTPSTPNDFAPDAPGTGFGAAFNTGSNTARATATTSVPGHLGAQVTAPLPAAPLPAAPLPAAPLPAAPLPAAPGQLPYPSPPSAYKAGTAPISTSVPVPAQPGGPVLFAGLPPLGEALVSLARHQAESPDRLGASGPNGAVEPTTPPPAPAPPAGAAAFSPGWYPDYATPDALRYWDGAHWTDHTHPSRPETDPPGGPGM